MRWRRAAYWKLSIVLWKYCHHQRAVDIYRRTAITIAKRKQSKRHRFEDDKIHGGGVCKALDRSLAAVHVPSLGPKVYFHSTASSGCLLATDDSTKWLKPHIPHSGLKVEVKGH
ncbi:uncharacterized protein LOC108162288 [Drosophila miranda]|uniref:uncharacterized protein LOC108162288 n=1 Tax=Drosophila miranda TaxID=7229 RepID=UPI00143F4E5F|nr:uncharacterized protein LOC108162288 [Drosophila miranda]